MQLSRPFHRCGCRIGYDLDGVILFSGAIVIGITIACIDGITGLVHPITVCIGSPHHVWEEVALLTAMFPLWMPPRLPEPLPMESSPSKAGSGSSTISPGSSGTAGSSGASVMKVSGSSKSEPAPASSTSVSVTEVSGSSKSEGCSMGEIESSSGASGSQSKMSSTMGTSSSGISTTPRSSSSSKLEDSSM